MVEFRGFSIVARFRLDYYEIRGSTGLHSGSLPFNIHVLDLPSVVSSAIPQYADDTVLYRPIYSVQDDINLQTDLDAIRTWSTINKVLSMPPNVWSCTSQDLVVPFLLAIKWVILLLKQFLLINTLG